MWAVSPQIYCNRKEKADPFTLIQWFLPLYLSMKEGQQLSFRSAIEHDEKKSDLDHSPKTSV